MARWQTRVRTTVKAVMRLWQDNMKEQKNEKFVLYKIMAKRDDEDE